MNISWGSFVQHMHDRWNLSPMHPAPKIKHFCFLTLHFESYSVSWSTDLQYQYYLAWTPPGAVLCHSHTCPVIRYQGEENGTSLSAFPAQDFLESNEAASKLCLLQAGQPTCPQALLTGYAFQPHYQLCCPPLAAIKHPEHPYFVEPRTAKYIPGKDTPRLTIVGE